MLSKIFRDAVKSVLRIGSAHNKGGPAHVNIAPLNFYLIFPLHLSNIFELKICVYSFVTTANQNCVKYSVSIS